MGLFSIFFGSRTKSQIDKEIASKQAELERVKANVANSKMLQRTRRNGTDWSSDIRSGNSRIADLKAQIARLKEERKNAPKG